MTLTEQFYAVTLSDAVSLYQSGDLTAKGAIKAWVRIRLKEGWSSYINPQEIRQLFKMSRSTFWRAFRLLQEEGEINFSESNKVYLTRVSVSQKLETVSKTLPESQKLDESPIQETNIPFRRHSDHILDNQPPEPLPEADSPELQINSDSYKTFLNSLSLEERESFLQVGEKTASALPKPPQLLLKWIESNWRDIKLLWEKLNPVASKNQNINWEKHPKFAQWVLELKSVGAFLFHQTTDSEKKAFSQYAYDHQKYAEWGIE